VAAKARRTGERVRPVVANCWEGRPTADAVNTTDGTATTAASSTCTRTTAAASTTPSSNAPTTATADARWRRRR
jgi:hypothetical protein